MESVSNLEIKLHIGEIFQRRKEDEEKEKAN